MTDAEIKSKVEAALTAYEEIPFKELLAALKVKLGERRAMAYRPALVTANQVLRFIFDDLNRPAQPPL